MDELIGRKLGQYRIEAKIGEGGMAAVFRAYQLSLERYVAVKVLPPSFAAKDPTFVKRFRREAKSIAGLHHPNILPVYDFGVEQDYSYIVMRYVESAQTLGQIVPQSLGDEQILDLISQVASALTYAHNKGIIHRDVKPGNVLLDGGWALLSDFGLAKVKEAATQLTDTGRSIGTAAYMSPEQAKGSVVDHRTDIYALGIILYEMLTGTIPHDAPTSLAILVKRTTEPPPSPRTINPAITESVEQVVLRSLAIRPDDRYDSAVDLAGALKVAMRDTAYRERVVGSLDRKTEVISAPHPITDSEYSKDSFKEKLSKAWHNPVWLAIIGTSAVVAVALLLWGGSAFSSAESQASPTQTVPAVAVASTATNTPLPSPTSTAMMTALPTDAPTPAPPTPSEVPTEVQILPTMTPTATSVPLTPTPTNVPTNTPTLPIASPTATMTPTSAVPEGTMTLLDPLSLDEPSYGPTNFEWQWTGDVPSGFGFEVRVWREGEPPAGVHDAVKDNRSGRIEKIGENKYRLNVDISDAAGVRGRSGQYLWTVGLAKISPNYAYYYYLVFFVEYNIGWR